MKFNKTVISIIILSSLTSIVNAQSKGNNEKSIDSQAKELKLTSKNSIITKEVIEASSKGTALRDQLREEEDIERKRASAIEASISKTESTRKLTVLEFINDNVPAHILAAGENEIQAYIEKNFIDANAKNNNRKTIETVWIGDSSSALSKPVVVDSFWGESKSTSDTLVVSESPITEKNKIDDKNNIEAGNGDADALEALGMTAEELSKLIGEVVVDNKSEPLEIDTGSESDKANTLSNVVIQDISLDRVVIMGKNTFVDVKLTMDVVRGDKSRTVGKEFNGMKKGTIFSVEGNRFELLEISEQAIVFENIDTNTTYRELLN